ncbi:hypothetical protein FAP39_05640 [Shimia litoralis]|uniref:Uncharacterized protein n=1 Tax=Shimia litoralis TaxID=420403 RepID=A0A4U7N8A1_9RHOB|nr:hypothetical protein [Shimia litoralis]TKZ21586.1 hypothetical protein FAP39_05640 [Shimia litoralis]
MDKIEQDKTGMFRPAWFSALLKGQLPLGETFWVGNWGTALFHQPLLALLVVLPLPSAVPGVLAVLLACFELALVRAVLIAKPGVPTPVGWRVAGVIVTLAIAALFASFARTLFS